MSLPLPLWVKVDRLFAPVRWLGQRLIEPLITISPNAGNDVVVMKFFGMGSIIRMLSICEDRGVNLSRVVLVTFEANSELCRLWGVRGIFVRNNSLAAMIRTSLSAIRQIAQLKPGCIVDFERSSNLTSILRTVIAWRAKCVTVGFELTSRESTRVKVHSIHHITQHQIFEEGVRELPVAKAERNNQWVEIKQGKVIVNINTSNLLTARRYDIKLFEKVIKRLLASEKVSVVLLTGTAEEWEYVQELASRFDSGSVVNVAGKWTLTRFVTELSDCDLFITGDSAPLHLAASMNVATISLWGPTQPGHFGYTATSTMHPLSLNMRCAPCFLHPQSQPAVACNGEITCMRELSPSLVADKAIEILNTLPPGREVIFPSKYVPLTADAFA